MIKSSHLLLVVASLVFVICYPECSASAQSLELQLERVEHIGENFLDCRIRVRKLNRTTHSLNGTATLLKDLDTSFEVSASFAYSSLGNNQFNEYPMKLPRKKVCRYMVEEYTEFQYIWANKSNAPQVPKGATEFCPFPKGEYWVKDLTPDASFIPPVVPTGLWRMTIEVWKQDTVDVKILLYCRVTKNLF
ncbi:uncharacterized protein LOC120412377 [Culex pipiens pallens]|uniref:uncharacterized protein LOC120412377 n=1 Tax=Culex pipiens pallens TaxID=42434 RepID=UPI00195302F5|nr:uncharacterized protein LOC120412377 [Culex pipiens pallens]